MLCWIIGFRHDFGDLTPFKTAATYPFFLGKNYMNDRFPCNTLLIKIVLPIPTNLTIWFQIVRIWIFWFLNWSYIYKVGPVYWLALTLDSFPRYDKWIKSLLSTRASSCTITYNPTKNGVPSGTEQTMSSQEHLHFYRKWWMSESTQAITSFKSHVAFYHIVSNEVLP